MEGYIFRTDPLISGPRSRRRSPNHMIFEPQTDSRVFTLFTSLPLEIRSMIWATALTPRIIKWARVDDRNVFTAPSKKLFPIFDVCRESRQSAIVYADYQNISTALAPVYFSPKLDYLFFDPGWVDPIFGGPATYQTRPDPLNLLLPHLPHLAKMRNIMVHPNYTDDRRRPTTFFEKLPLLEQVLVAADEKSIGFQAALMIGTINDITTYYAIIAKKRNPDIKVPYIAVGCLGWTGDERRSMHHGNKDNRQLVGVFENPTEMKDHLQMIREQEWKFTQDQFKNGRPRLTLNLRGDAKRSLSSPQVANNSSGSQHNDPPPYSENPSLTAAPGVTELETEAPLLDHKMKGKWEHWKEACRKVLRGETWVGDH